MREYEGFAEWVRRERWRYFHLPVPEALIRDVWDMDVGEAKEYTRKSFLSSIVFCFLVGLLLSLGPLGTMMTVMLLALVFLIPTIRNTFIIKPALMHMKMMYHLSDGRVARKEDKRQLTRSAIIYSLTFIMMLIVLHWLGALETIKNFLTAMSYK